MSFPPVPRDTLVDDRHSRSFAPALSPMAPAQEERIRLQQEPTSALSFLVSRGIPCKARSTCSNAKVSKND